MQFDPRHYQQDAHDNAMAHLKKSLDSQVLVLPTGAGKSIVVSMLAKSIHDLSGKRVLCTAPNAKLVKQNHGKYIGYGFRASVYCASAGRKELKHDVVFGSPLSLLNAAHNLRNYSAIIIDECDLITPTVINLIDVLRADNPKLRIIGLTATPYRMGMGYIYAAHYRLGFMEQTVNPYFKLCAYECYAKELIEQGYLTRPILGKQRLHYETGGLIMKSNGKWDQRSVDTAFVGHGRLTSDIIADVIETCRDYRGVMIFAATEAHCHEVMASLPSELSCLAISANAKARKRAEDDFYHQRKKYIVNISTQSVGCDYPHADVVVMLRRTESARLYQQIIGRILRLYPEKEHALILDYAENNLAHFPDGDVFNPKIKAKKQGESETLIALCPECSHENEFAIRPNDAGYEINENGYFVWVDSGDLVTDKEGRNYPAHFGRRCFGIVKKNERCDYRWTFKKCTAPCCSFMNDIAARRCEHCNSEIIDPNEKLAMEEQSRSDAAKSRALIEFVTDIKMSDHIAKSGAKLRMIQIKTISGKTIRLFLRLAIKNERETYHAIRALQSKDSEVIFNKPKDSQDWKFISINEVLI